MNKVRGFEIVTDYVGKGIVLPERATQQAAGYDFQAAEDIVIPTIWNVLLKNQALQQGNTNEDASLPQENKEYLASTLVPTGIKAYMQEDEYLQLANRSSNPIKNQLSMPNGVGIVDADYYGNEKNEGHIYFQFINYGLTDYVIKKGDRIGQGIFMSYLTVDNEVSSGIIRTGGFGSSGK